MKKAEKIERKQLSVGAKVLAGVLAAIMLAGTVFSLLYYLI